MKTRNLPRFSTAVFLCTPACALALGVGQLEVRSGLNQALNGTIPLRSTSEEDLANLSVGLASPQAFARLGLERAAVLSDIEFSVETDMAGNPYVRVTSSQPIREPLLDFLIELEWPGGRVVRELAVLLDPAPLMPPAPASLESPQPFDAPRGWRRLSPPADTVETPVDPGISYTESEPYGPVRYGETLWKIASRFRPDPSISMQRMMQVVFDTNPRAFNRGNMDSLKAGVMLNIPVFEGFESARVASQASADLSQRTDPEEPAPAAADIDPVSTSEPAGIENAQVKLAPIDAEEEFGEDSATQANPMGDDLAVIPTHFKIPTKGDQLRLKMAGLEDLRLRIADLVDVDNSALTPARESSDVVDWDLASGQREADLSAGFAPKTAVGGMEPDTVTPETTTADRSEVTETLLEAPAVSPAAPLSIGPIHDAEAEGVPPPAELSDSMESASESTSPSQVDGDDRAEPSGEPSQSFTVPATAANPASSQAVLTSSSENGQRAVDQEPGSSKGVLDVLRDPAVILENPSVLIQQPLLLVLVGSGVLALIVLLMLPLLWLRRRRGEAPLEEADELSFEAIDQPEEEQPEFQTAVAYENMAGAESAVSLPQESSQASTHSMERIDLLLAVGDHREAENVVRNALADDPTNPTLAVKLLEILSAANDADGFLAEADIMYDWLKGASDQWDHVAKMGRELCPETPLFRSGADAEMVADQVAASRDAADQGVIRDEAHSAPIRTDSESSESIEFDIEHPAASEDSEPLPAQAPQDDFANGLPDLEWQISEPVTDEPISVDNGPGQATAEAGGDDLDAQLRSLNFDFDDLIGQRPKSDRADAGNEDARKGASSLAGNEFEADALWEGKSQIGEDFEGSLRELGFDFDDLQSNSNGSSTTSGPTDPGGISENPDAPPPERDTGAALDAELEALDFTTTDSPPNGTDDLTDGAPAASGLALDATVTNDFVETKLDLAAAYLEMEDYEGAGSLLEEVTREGAEQQKQRAEELMKQVRALKA